MSDATATVDTKGAVLAFNEGAAAAEQGDEETAALLWRKALELDPGLVPAARNLVTYHQNRGDQQPELDLWELILAFDPFDTDHLVLQAAAFRRAARHRQALDSYHRAISIYPYFKFWYHELAGIYAQLGEHEEAALWRGRGDSLGADAAEICYEDGLRHVTEERWKSARTCFEAVLDEFPANLDARLRLAKVLEQAGTSDEVVNEYNTAMELTETAHGLVHYRLAEYFIKDGDLESAEAEFDHAVRSVPIYRKAERALARVRHHLGHTASVGQVVPGPAHEHLLKAEDIGMERITDLPVFRSPQLRAPNPRLPWNQQVRQVLDQALSVSAPGGSEPRVALLVEPDQDLAEPAQAVMAELRSLGRSLRADAEESHIFILQSQPQQDGHPPGLSRQGWLGQDAQAELAVTGWRHTRPGMPLNSALDVLTRGAGEHGFNCLIVVGFGRCYELDANTLDLVATTPLHCVCFIHPRYHYIDLRSAFAGRTPNYVEIAI